MYRILWCVGIICTISLLIGLPMLGYGGFNIPYELTRDEIRVAERQRIPLGEFLEQKQHSSHAWKIMIIGAGFSSTGLVFGFCCCSMCYCSGLFRRQPTIQEPPC